MTTLIDEYKSAIGNRRVRSNFAKPFLPQPTFNDYQRGYIIRYFVRARNDLSGLVTEVDRTQFESQKQGISRGINSGYYTSVSLRWKISGTIAECEEANFNAVLEAERQMRGIRRKLGNLIQFVRLTSVERNPNFNE